MSSLEYSSLIKQALELARPLLQGRDASHDLEHALRVMNLATLIAMQEGTPFSEFDRIQLAQGTSNLRNS